MASESRQYELVLLGATGYTGRLTAEHITTHLPTDLKWAISGRNGTKLTQCAEELRKLNPDRSQPGIEILELNNEELDTLVRKTRLVITTVGPFMQYGTPVVEACAKNGTHYVDCTGEVPWVFDMISKYHDMAQASGAIMIPQSGFDSAPADLIAFVVATHLRRTLNVSTAEVLTSVDVRSNPSGGSLLTALSMFDFYSSSQIADSYKPFALSPVQPPVSSAPPSQSFRTNFFGTRYDRELGFLADWYQSAMDTAVVQRSWGLLAGGEAYGPNFRFGEWMAAKSSFHATMVHLKMASDFEIRAAKNDYAHFRAVGVADSPNHERVVATLKVKGSLYSFTGLAIAEAAMVILRGGETEAKKLGGGILTPATLGDEYVERLRAVGVEFDVKIL
ncbi:Saccharopine dehydrogenase-domain-containing protein [Ilyonectria robusta]|uniref:Saccharopine dehydrogenase-domain-containing protein n=1 Tax=Ilyonectria robusta TaxID=1079257 RepID=UPI001E8CB96D|nr:Saccharopine dehydrogenase-domain-containing protein [Ilyonectria robusta]KAH8652028.1 Saccharopine dehydrogenase-domain-containing protein [Ilyonectria robusta]